MGLSGPLIFFAGLLSVHIVCNSSSQKVKNCSIFWGCAEMVGKDPRLSNKEDPAFVDHVEPRVFHSSTSMFHYVSMFRYVCIYICIAEGRKC